TRCVGRGGWHAGRPRAGLPHDAGRPGGRHGAGRRRRGATGVPRCLARGLPLSLPRRDGDEPPGTGRADGLARRAADGGPVAGRTVRRRELPSEFHAVAPVRLDFAGGWTDVPPFSGREGGVVVNAGSGLGTSGAMDVALVAALTLARGERLAERDIAEQGWYLEAVEAKLPGGRQDQFAAALGGFHRFSFRDPDVGVEPITLDPAFAT